MICLRGKLLIVKSKDNKSVICSVIYYGYIKEALPVELGLY